tara:strand:+ start:3640 stop:5004 length:1365 start_codon:yes stop_codon:yes gene_type:complete
MSLKINIFVLYFLSLLHSSLFAKSFLNFELLDALSSTYDFNPKLKIERQKLFQKDELMPQALSEFRPKVEGYYEKGKVDTALSGSNFVTDGVRTETSAGIKITQPIFNGGKSIFNLSAAKFEIFSQRYNLQDFEQQVFLEVIKIYSSLASKLSEIELNRKNVEFLKQQFNQANDQFDIGEITLTDVSISQARLLQAEANLIRSESELLSLKSKYKLTVGIESKRPELFFNFPEINDELDNFIKDCLENNPMIKSTDFLIKSVSKKISSLYSSKLPSVNFEAEARKSKGYFKSDSSREVMTAFAKLDFPIYQSGLASSKIREVKKELLGLKELKFSQMNELKYNATFSWSEFKSSEVQVQANLKQIEANKNFLEGLRQEFLLGERTILDILDAEQELIESEFNLVKSYEQNFNAYFALLSYKGLLNSVFLGLPVKHFDDTKNYNDVKFKWLDIIE